MRQRLLIFGVVIGFLVCLTGYYFALEDWIVDCRTGVYAANHAEAVLETSAILIYSYAGFVFYRKRFV